MSKLNLNIEVDEDFMPSMSKKITKLKLRLKKSKKPEIIEEEIKELEGKIEAHNLLVKIFCGRRH